MEEKIEQKTSMLRLKEPVAHAGRQEKTFRLQRKVGNPVFSSSAPVCTTEFKAFTD